MTEQNLYKDKELQLLKQVFEDNERLLITMRKQLLGAKLSKEDKDTLKSTFSNKELLTAVRRKAYGIADLEAPIGQYVDFWVGLEKQLGGQNKDTIKQAIEYKKKTFDMFEKGFNSLENPHDSEQVSIEIEFDDLGISLIARNLYMQAVEQTLVTLKALSGTKAETLEDTMKRIKQNSTK